MSDAHALLGLAPGASSAEIKKAFRRLAMRWHPDRNPDPAAVEHFKALRAAYETLTAQLAEDDVLDIELAIELETAFTGGMHIVELAAHAACPVCAGSGEEVLRHTRLCGHCHGSGRLRTASGLSPCPHCAGRGYLSRQPCSRCEGSGRVTAIEHFEVELPAGIADGDSLRVRARPAADGTATARELRLQLRVAAHPLFRLHGRDLHLERPVSALLMLAGGALELPTPGGRLTHELASGPAGARELRIPGAGLPARGAQPAGDLIVQLVPILPAAPDADMRALLAQLEALCAADRSRQQPDVALWERRWLCDAAGP